jgi:hypothetical protein
MVSPSSQWARLLQNQGTWVGSFTQLSPSGQVQQDIPSRVELLPLNGGNTLRQTIRKYPPDQLPNETVLEFSSLGRGVLFCETGAFSQGAIQRSPVAEFGAELGLLHGSERLRIVPIFPHQPTLGSLTLIREHRAGTAPTPRSALTLDQLLGTWVGTATTHYPDWQPPQTLSSRLVIQRLESNRVGQTLSLGGEIGAGAAGDRPLVDTSLTLYSEGTWTGNTLHFSQSRQPVTVLLLPSGASATVPTEIQSGQPLFLEAGWLITPTLRQRLIRTYNAQGTWVSLTLVIEQKEDS